MQLMRQLVKKLRIINIFVVICILLLTSGCFNGLNSNNELKGKKLNGYTEYKFDNEAATMFLGCTISEFFENGNFLISAFPECRENAYIDNDGNLVLLLNEKQEYVFFNSYTVDLSSYNDDKRVSISDDYKVFTITGTPESIGDFIINSFSFFTVRTMLLEQFKNGEPIEKIYTTVKVIDEVSGKTLYTATMPGDEITFDVQKGIYIPESTTVYKFDDTTAMMFLGCTVSEFPETDNFLDAICPDYRENAYIDDDGNLVLLFNNKQKYVFHSVLVEDLSQYDDDKRISISDDYKMLTITGTPETIGDFILNSYSDVTVRTMLLEQFKKGEDTDNISVTVKVIDEETGEILYFATQPDEEIILRTHDGIYVPEKGQ